MDEATMPGCRRLAHSQDFANHQAPEEKTGSQFTTWH